MVETKQWKKKEIEVNAYAKHYPLHIGLTVWLFPKKHEIIVYSEIFDELGNENVSFVSFFKQ